MSVHVHMTRPADWYTSPPAHVGVIAKAWPFVRALFRAGVGLLFMEHGLQKIFGFFGGMGPQGGTVPLASTMGVAGVLELVGGLLLILGLLTRPVGFILMCEMLVAYFTAHMPHGGWPIQNHGELALLYALVFAFFAVDGAGPVSIDHAVEQSRQGMGSDLR